MQPDLFQNVEIYSKKEAYLFQFYQGHKKRIF